MILIVSQSKLSNAPILYPKTIKIYIEIRKYNYTILLVSGHVGFSELIYKNTNLPTVC